LRSNYIWCNPIRI